MKKLAFCLFVVICYPAFAQENGQKASLEVFGFVDLYYGIEDQDQVGTDKRLPFLYNHARPQRFAVNLALVTFELKADRFRANLGLQQGTYPQDNYAAEPKALRWINQANVGYALNEKKSVWLDAGVLPSHIGFENAISTENLTLSRSIIAENSPYFETGVQLSWQKSEVWYFAFLVLNGWQRIQFIPGRNKPSFGTQAKFSPSENTSLNWSTFVGTDQSNEAETMLYFSNLFAEFDLGETWSLIAGLDAGKRTIPGEFNPGWWGASLIGQYRFTDNFSTAVRAEYYDDEFQAIAASLSNTGIKTSGFSLNLDYNFEKIATLRVEGRYFTAPGGAFLGLSDTANSDMFFVLTSLAFSLN
ncbi:porin [Algoriphagus vanfongensis]|uniref:porin n=1 Tax=Algoriphagus vanfongensis TaxID=426371 RepID=UPI000405C255|nr:porin [Algoriphagus vanfongensis]